MLSLEKPLSLGRTRYSRYRGFLAIAKEDAYIRVQLWSVNEPKLLHTLEGHTSCGYHASFSLDGSQLASSSSDKMVQL